jgi:hypothetical protein
MLRDESVAVRMDALYSMEHICGPVSLLKAVIESHQAGFSSTSSVELLCLYNPPELFDLLEQLIMRYEPAKLDDDVRPDSVGAIVTAAEAFRRCQWNNRRINEMMCGLLEKEVEPLIRGEAVRTFMVRGPAGGSDDIAAMKMLWKQLTILDPNVRSVSAAALNALGEPVGGVFESLLESNRPQGSLLRQIHSAFVNPDVGQALTEAAQHVANWIGKVSRETAERFSSSSPKPDSAWKPLNDSRLAELIVSLLSNSLDTLERNSSEDQIVDALSTGTACLRLLRRIERNTAISAVGNVQRAFTCIKVVNSGKQARAYEEGTEVASILREAAGLAIIDLKLEDSLEMLVAGLNCPHDGVKRTSAFALGTLGDARAVPALQIAIETGSPEIVLAARDAITAIKRGNPEMTTLLRGSSSADAHLEALVRPVTEPPDLVSADTLLRPGNSAAPEQ